MRRASSVLYRASRHELADLIQCYWQRKLTSLMEKNAHVARLSAGRLGPSPTLSARIVAHYRDRLKNKHTKRQAYCCCCTSDDRCIIRQHAASSYPIKNRNPPYYVALWLSGDNFVQAKHAALLPLGTAGWTKGACRHCCGRKLPGH